MAGQELFCVRLQYLEKAVGPLVAGNERPARSSKLSFTFDSGLHWYHNKLKILHRYCHRRAHVVTKESSLVVGPASVS